MSTDCTKEISALLVALGKPMVDKPNSISENRISEHGQPVLFQLVAAPEDVGKRIEETDAPQICCDASSQSSKLLTNNDSASQSFRKIVTLNPTSFKPDFASQEFYLETA
jgi:hypothetical protein